AGRALVPPRHLVNCSCGGTRPPTPPAGRQHRPGAESGSQADFGLSVRPGGSGQMQEKLRARRCRRQFGTVFAITFRAASGTGRRGRLVRLSAAVAAVAALSAPAGALAAAATWDGGAAVGTVGDNVTWTTAANWTTGGVVATA